MWTIRTLTAYLIKSSRDTDGSTDLQCQSTGLSTVIMAFSSWPQDDFSSSELHGLTVSWGQSEWQKSLLCFSSREETFHRSFPVDFSLLAKFCEFYIATPMGKAIWKEYICMSYSYMPLYVFIGSIVIGEHERGGFKMTMAISMADSCQYMTKTTTIL